MKLFRWEGNVGTEHKDQAGKGRDVYIRFMKVFVGALVAAAK
jgi:hypothetical protein